MVGGQLTRHQFGPIGAAQRPVAAVQQ